MGVRYVVSEPDPPTWWAKNKAAVYAVLGLAVGFYLAGGGGGDAQPAPGPVTGPTASTTPTATR
ncbi:hypothetical protein OG264_39640 (plasmid) [Streptomyces xanthophaeus]|uniref:hypothetical protein n=1 Tax=Streptomyces xanthophaeus TaxID=67385 RepID=UPI002F906919|nr:hypothetical protein OG264_39795 [Streptomyces xanthophaeus]WST27646.1 hypothetical protein OG264_39640 [Streptomyces xanthophaeus]WST65986.1 hypothetical protein OG605_40970 [Streptomyces xanthophaeus]WST66014.1 hypothetical protein OG605_40815 [Streptomyces xanthophaeus]